VIPHLIGQQTVGRFEIRDFLGRGAIGDVLLAWDPREERLVALKVVRTQKTDPEMLEAEKNGLSLQAQLAKVAPQVAAVYEHGQDGDLFWVAMEYVAGSDLSEILARGALPEARAVGIALQLVSMLEVCHEFSAEVGGRRILGIIHGDIKPENIRLQEEDRVRVLDFGIAKHLSQTRRFTVNLFGSLPYTPPERLERGVVDRHSDLWAVGVVLAAMVSGRRPFPGNTPEELEQAIRRGVPHLPLPAACSPGLAQVVDRALAYEAARRYPTAAELRADLEALRDGRPLIAAAPESEADALHATRRTVRPLSPEEVRAAEATRRTDRLGGAPPSAPGSAVDDTRRTGEGGAATAVPAPNMESPDAEAQAAPGILASSGAAVQAAPGILASSGAAVQAAPGLLAAPAPPAQIAPGAQVQTPVASPAAPVAPGALAAAQAVPGIPAAPPRPRRLLRRVFLALAAVFAITVTASQLWAWNQAQQMRREMAEVHPDLASVAERYRRVAPWSLFSLDLFGVGDELVKALGAAGERILDSYHGDAPTTTQRGWQAAYDDLHAAAQIAPRDRKIRARMLYARAHLDRIASVSQRNQGDRKAALATSREAAAEFQEASRADPDWADPYLGLARIYAYDLFDLDALQKALGQAARHGYRLGRRETAMLADGFRMKGLELEARAQRAQGTSAEIDLLAQARAHLEQAVRFYGDIAGYASSASNRDEAESHLAAVEQRLSLAHRPGFWERIGRAIRHELRKPGGP
jgi:hypothetical protein